MSEKGVETAIDISDGLVADLAHICKASRVSARVRTDLIPIHPAVPAYFGEKALDFALSGGEDYELLFTASAEVVAAVSEAVSCPVTVIGEIIPEDTEKIHLMNEEGKEPPLRRTGWNHFTST